MQSTVLSGRPSGLVNPVNSLVPLILFLAISFFGFSQISRADVILPRPHKVEKRLDGTLDGNSLGVSLKTDAQSYSLYFGSNEALKALAQKLIGKRVILRGYPMEYKSAAKEDNIEVTSIVEAK
jgi:hypothetical protein